MGDLKEFFSSEHFIDTRGKGAYESAQWGAHLTVPTSRGFDWEEADIVIVGCGEQRGAHEHAAYSNGPDAIRQEFYKLYAWHDNIKIADAGNIVEGVTIGDTRAALRTVLHELQEAGKIVVVLGGSHDLTLQQYEAYKKSEQIIKATVADMLIDMDETEVITDHSFLMDMLTEQPNFIAHYNHIGFQSYYVHPKILETLDKLRFDFFRVGIAREHMEDMEPVLRSSNLFSFDMNAIRNSDAPANVTGSPNGFSGDEACLLAKYAGMATRLNSFGIYGYDSRHDVNTMTARQVAQMLWYFLDGVTLRKNEASLDEKDEFISFDVTFTENDTTFLKSKRTNRWWMQLPDGNYVPCSYKDYQVASTGDIPERWLREQERLV